MVPRAALFHYRTKDAIEVDAILETSDGRIIAIEVKAGVAVRSEDLAGLRHLTRRLDGQFIADGQWHVRLSASGTGADAEDQPRGLGVVVADDEEAGLRPGGMDGGGM